MFRKMASDILDNYTLAKTATPRWVKQQRGGLLNPENLARTVHSTGQIRQLGKQPLGQGVEGVVHKVTHPASPTGVAARKIYDPAGPLFSRPFYREKAKMYQAMQNQPWALKYYGRDTKRPITYHELADIAPSPFYKKNEFFSKTIPMPSKVDWGNDKTLLGRIEDQRQRRREAKFKELERAPAESRKYTPLINEYLKSKRLPGLIDLHGGNLVNLRGGGTKVLDFLPANLSAHSTPASFRRRYVDGKYVSDDKLPVKEYLERYVNKDRPSPQEVIRRAYGVDPKIQRPFSETDPRYAPKPTPQLDTRNIFQRVMDRIKKKAG